MNGEAVHSRAIADELSRIEEAARVSAQAQFTSAKFWRGLNLTLGIPAAALAAVAGTTVLAEVISPDAGAAIALVVAALTAVMTTLNAAQRAEQSMVAATTYLALQGEARVVRSIDLDNLDEAAARARLEQLIERRNAVNKSAPPTSLLSYTLGKRNIAKGRQTYAVDE
jgi:hypothetical protein